ncbi:uroporphyrinogen decarboxylase family protein [Roseburia hominis]
MEKVKRPNDQMTPIERKKAIESGQEFDRFPCIPFMGEFKCQFTGISFRDFWYDPEKMAKAEIAAFNRYGYDRIVIGPNTRGITEALGGRFVYPEKGLPYADKPFLKQYEQLEEMEPVRAETDSRIQVFADTAKRLEEAGKIVPMEMSIGGPFTIASQLRGVELLLRDTRKCSDSIMKLLRIVTDSQKSCIDMAARYGFGIAMADPVANPALIGPKLYEKFVFPFTKELTDYALEKTGKKVSLHMCGTTYSIWKYLRQYELNELSLDNIIDLERAAKELGDAVPIAGNVDPVEIVMNGTKEEIYEGVKACISVGKSAKKGYHLATGCDIPETTLPQKIDWFMEAARECGNGRQGQKIHVMQKMCGESGNGR